MSRELRFNPVLLLQKIVCFAVHANAVLTCTQVFSEWSVRILLELLETAKSPFEMVDGVPEGN